MIFWGIVISLLIFVAWAIWTIDYEYLPESTTYNEDATVALCLVATM